MTLHQRKISAIVSKLLDWFSQNARDLPWRRTRDPYAIWVSEIMLQQTQVKTVLPFWERWMRELPTIEAVAGASSDKIHKLWEGLGYYHRARNLQKAARQIVESGKRRPERGKKLVSSYGDCDMKAAEDCRTPKRKRGSEAEAPCVVSYERRSKSETRYLVSYEFPEKFEEVLALPGIGRYTAGAICSIAFNQPAPILDGNVMRVLTRVFGIEKDPREKETNGLLWRLAEDLVSHAQGQRAQRNSRTRTRTSTRRMGNCCSHLNQSLMELGALVCTPRNPQCVICPVKKLCVAYKTHRIAELPNLGKRAAATARRFVAFVVEHRGKFLVRQRPEDVVNAHLWEFPNVELNGHTRARAASPAEVFKSQFGFAPPELLRLPSVKHSITRYRITLEAFRVSLKTKARAPKGLWFGQPQLDALAFTSAHRKVLSRL